MTKPTNLISLDQRRRAQRALHFFADLLGGGSIQPLGGLSPPLPDVHHLPRLKMDIAVTREPAPAHLKQILAFAHRRQLGFLLIRFRDPAPIATEALVDAVLFDVGIAALEGLSPASADGKRWTLVGRQLGDVHLRVAKGELVPTLADPWTDENDRHLFISKADQIFADYLWRV